MSSGVGWRLASSLNDSVCWCGTFELDGAVVDDEMLVLLDGTTFF